MNLRMRNFFQYLFVLYLAIGSMSASTALADPVSFRNDLAHGLLDNCLACHGEKKAEGGYRVDTFELLFGEGDSGMAGFVAGDLEESEAFRRIVSDDVDERMPLEGDPLPDEFVTLLRQWIEEGAKFDGTDLDAPLASYAPLSQDKAPAEYSQTVPIAAVHFNADGSKLFVGGYYEITVWNVADGRLLRRLTGASQRTTAIDISPDGKTLAVAGGTPGKHGTVRLFDVKTGELKNVFKPLSDMVLDLQYSPDGARLAAGTAASLLVVYEAENGEIQSEIAGHSDWVTSVAWSPDGKSLVSGSRDKTAKVFNLDTGEILITYPKHSSAVRGVAFHPEAAEIYSAGADNKIHRWTLADGKKLAEIPFDGEVYKLSLFDSTLFATSADKTVRQYDTKTHVETKQYKGHQDWTISVAFHAASKQVASGGFDGEIIVWNSEDATELTRFIAAPGYKPASIAIQNLTKE